MKICTLISQFLLLGLCVTTSYTINANPRIAILNFELNDITSLPNTPEEVIRTGSIKPLLEQAIEKKGHFEIIQINTQAQHAANAGFGYLFNFNEVAATLGKQVSADWVVVGQHSKPSFLYSYLMAHLVNVKNHSLSARCDIELKGNHAKVTERGVKMLANKIADSIDKYQQ